MAIWNPMVAALAPRTRSRVPLVQPAMAPEPYVIPGSEGGGPDGGNQSDVRGQARDQASYGSFSEMMNNPGFRGDWGKVGAMLSPGMSLASNLITGNDPIQGPAPGGGLGKGGMADDLAAFGGNDPRGGGDLSAGGVSAADLGADLAANNSTGNFAKGGRITAADLSGPNPPGPDQGYVAAMPDEIMLNPRQQQMLPPDARMAMARVLMATGARNVGAGR